MPKYKFTYFAVRGRGEPVRWMFAYADQPYEDERLDREAHWPTRKSDTPYGKLPVLYIDDDKSIYSSSVICRYLGREFGLMPEDTFQQAVCDEVVDALNDIIMTAYTIFMAKKNGKKDDAKRLAADFATTVFPPVGKGLEKRLKNHEWFGGNKISWADIYASYFISLMSTIIPDLLSCFPKVKSVTEKVVASPGVAKWIKERPVTDM